MLTMGAEGRLSVVVSFLPYFRRDEEPISDMVLIKVEAGT